MRTSTFDVVVLATELALTASLTFEDTIRVDASVVVVQVEWGSHVAAIMGLIVLALLGTVLVLKNRIETADSFTAETDTNAEPFMTDRERVSELLRRNGGRMRQSEIVDEVDWSKAKVSRLLADLEEEDQITKLRLGRENLICLSGHEPTASKIPEQSKQ